MTANSNILQELPDKKPVRIFFPIKDQSEMYRVQGVFEQTNTSRFRIFFDPAALPNNIDTKKNAIIRLDIGGSASSLEAVIDSISDNRQVVELMLQKSINHEQLREFFRVDAVTPVVSKSYGPDVEDGEHWEVQGESIDISGSGILAVFSRRLPKSKYIQLEITLPKEFSNGDTITIIAHQVRAQEMEDGRYQVAFHYDKISDEDRDKIIGCCLVLQRQMLRLKIRVKDEF